MTRGTYLKIQNLNTVVSLIFVGQVRILQSQCSSESLGGGRFLHSSDVARVVWKEVVVNQVPNCPDLTSERADARPCVGNPESLATEQNQVDVTVGTP
jgi:hypothetical protein